MENPSNLLLKLSRSLFTDTAEQQKFIQAVTNPQCFNLPILWLQPKPTENSFDLEIPLPWKPEFSEWLLSKFQEFLPMTVPHLVKDRSHLTEIPCHRM